MGGYGSGKYQSYDAKDTVEESITLSIFKLSREGLITWGGSSRGMLTGGSSCSMAYAFRDNTLMLQYTFKSGKFAGQEIRYPIKVTETHLHAGGRRIWWQCPACDRRCGKLYLAPGQKYYLCRGCANLTYQSTREMGQAKLWKYIQNFDQRLARRMQRAGVEWPSDERC